jgi:transposase
MFLRNKTTSHGHALQLVESYRNEKNEPRQRVLLSLGDVPLCDEDRSCAKMILAQRLEGHADLFIGEASPEVLALVDRIATELTVQKQRSRKAVVPATPADDIAADVLVGQVTHERASELGPELVALRAWEALGMPALLTDIGLNPAQRTCAAVSVINRLCDPVSEHRLPEWSQGTALVDLLGDVALQAEEDSYYRASDLLRRHHGRIEKHLCETQKRLFSLKRTILLYDLTNTHFEGLCAANPKAKRGKNKQGRDDCLQVVVGMVFDEFGFPLAHNIFNGNQHDGRSLPAMLRKLQANLDGQEPDILERPLVIMDGGIASRENLALIRSLGYDYLVNASRQGRTKYAEAFAQDDQFCEVSDRSDRPPVSVRLIDWSEGEGAQALNDHLVLCKSPARGLKESAMLSTAETRFLADLGKLKARVESGKLRDEAKIQQALGKIKAKNPRIQRYYDIKLISYDKNSLLMWTCLDEERKSAEALTGCYVLRTNKDRLDADGIWHLYMTLLHAESGFKALKSDLGLRPNFHQKENRVDGHVFITILAYHLQRFICHKLEQQGDHRSWESLRRVLRTHCYATIVLPTRGGDTYRIRKAGTAEASQKAIYQALGIDTSELPKHRFTMSPPYERHATL